MYVHLPAVTSIRTLINYRQNSLQLEQFFTPSLKLGSLVQWTNDEFIWRFLKCRGLREKKTSLTDLLQRSGLYFSKTLKSPDGLTWRETSSFELTFLERKKKHKTLHESPWNSEKHIPGVIKKIGTSQLLYLKLASCQRGTLSEFQICWNVEMLLKTQQRSLKKKPSTDKKLMISGKISFLTFLLWLFVLWFACVRKQTLSGPVGHLRILRTGLCWRTSDPCGSHRGLLRRAPLVGVCVCVCLSSTRDLLWYKHEPKTFSGVPVVFGATESELGLGWNPGQGQLPTGR